MGTIFTTPVVEVDDAEALTWLRRHGYRLIAADPAAEQSYRGDHYSAPLAIILGSERDGLRSHLRDAADVVVSVPMHGVADSLNVGHAAALLLYEALHRQSPPR